MSFKLPNIKNLFNKDKKKELEEVAGIDAGEGAVSSDTFVKTNMSDVVIIKLTASYYSRFELVGCRIDFKKHVVLFIEKLDVHHVFL